MNTANSLYILLTHSSYKNSQREASFKYIPQGLYGNGRPYLDHSLGFTYYKAGA
jgi:hypothetical protein